MTPIRASIGRGLFRPLLPSIAQVIDVVFALFLGRLNRVTMFLLVVPIVGMIGICTGFMTLTETGWLCALYFVSVFIRSWVLSKFMQKMALE